MQVKKEVKALIASGVYDQNTIFNKLYPIYTGHYAKLRDIISEVKNDDANQFNG